MSDTQWALLNLAVAGLVIIGNVMIIVNDARWYKNHLKKIDGKDSRES